LFNGILSQPPDRCTLDAPRAPRGRERSPPRHPASRKGKNSQAAQKGPDARRRPRAAREAYFLYVERAAEGANLLGGGFAPSDTSPQDSLRRQSRRSKSETLLPGRPKRPGSERKRRLITHRRMFRSERGLRPRHSGGGFGGGPSRPPPRERRRWAFFSSLPPVNGSATARRSPRCPPGPPFPRRAAPGGLPTVPRSRPP
jgi:hypothetical protein